MYGVLCNIVSEMAYHKALLRESHPVCLLNYNRETTTDQIIDTTTVQHGETNLFIGVT